MAEQEVDFGFCHCGCGRPTNLANKTDASRGWEKGKPLKYIRFHHLKNLQQPGEKHARWNGGKKAKKPYMLVLMRYHPRADIDGYVREHILIAEKALGKSLPEKAVVHHHTPEQLVICQDTAYHNLLHQRTRALMACGHSSWRKCKFCKNYDIPENVPDGYHNKCRSEHRQRRNTK